ncbi:MAG: class I SAM-dependent methyltransferase [Nanoarchaeota archaeon]
MNTNINLERISKTKNYHKWIYNKIAPFLGKNILEVGSGLGSMTNHICRGRKICCIDILDYNLRKSKHIILKMDISKSSLKKGFDTVVCINVLEHIKHDKKALHNMYCSTKKGGNLILIVPAFQLPYGSIDIMNKHFRRYDKKEIKEKVVGAGFDIKKIFYMNFIGLLGWWYHSKLLKIKMHNEIDIARFDKLCPFFEFMENIINPPMGLSLVIIGEK